MEENEGKKIFIYDRVDELEKITLELMEEADTIKPTLKDMSTIARDARILAIFALGTAFGASAADVQNPRALKDSYISNLRQVGLSPKMLDVAEKVLIEMCKLIEKAKTSK